MRTVTKWEGGQAFESTYKSDKIKIDAHLGFSPKALLLTGLAGCTGVDIVGLLEKMRVPFASLEIDVETEQTDTHPRVFKDIKIVYKIKAEEESRSKIVKAIDLSLQKYCGVAAMLQKNSSISYTLDIQPE